MTEALAQEMMRWAKDTPIVFYCHMGQRSLDAASYFAGHGFTNIHSMTSGIDAWSIEVDSSVPRYEVAPKGLAAAG
jgi:rhodanese-related sulfurtransferase